MQTLKARDYSWIEDWDWTHSVHQIHVRLYDKKSSKTIKMNYLLDNKSVYEKLVSEDVIIASEENKKFLNDMVRECILRNVKKEVENYNLLIKVNNELVNLDVKDKRTHGDASNNGKIKPNEIKVDLDNFFYNYEVKRLSVRCPYDYNFDSDVRYIYKQGIVKGGFFDMEIDLEVKLEPEQRIPNPKLAYNLTSLSNEWEEVSFLRSATLDRTWKKGKRVETISYSNYRVSDNGREVTLNTFIAMCRSKSKFNLSEYFRKAEGEKNKIEMMNLIQSKFKDSAEVVQVSGYKQDLTHNYYKYWNRYAQDVVKVTFKDKSFLYFDYQDLVRSRTIVLLGVYDSTHKPEQVKDVYERVVETNTGEAILIDECFPKKES
jgi:hypothetical protein